MQNSKIAGILLIISSVLMLLAGIAGILFIIAAFFFMGNIGGPADTFGIFVLGAMMFVPIAVIFGLIQLIAGIRCLQQKNWVFTLIGCIFGIMTNIAGVVIIFLAIPGVLSIIALVLLAGSKDEFVEKLN